MAYFTQAYHSFFKELAANNHRDWFHANKKRYEADVKKPFDRFVGEVIEALKAEGEAIEIQPKDAIFRINRDIRFSKDKSPYKLNRSAIISKYGRKDKSYPGLYMDFGPEKLWIGGGAYFLDKEQLYDVRDHMLKHPKKFKNAIGDKDFIDTYGEIQGEKNKIVPKEFKAISEDLPEIMNKQFYFMSEHAPSDLLKDDLLDKVMQCWKASRKMDRFLQEALTH